MQNAAPREVLTGLAPTFWLFVLLLAIAGEKLFAAGDAEILILLGEGVKGGNLLLALCDQNPVHVFHFSWGKYIFHSKWKQDASV